MMRAQQLLQLLVLALLLRPAVAIDENLGTFLGVGMNCFGAVMAASALVVQKYTHMEDKDKPEEERRWMICRPKWWIGVALLGISGLMEVRLHSSSALPFQQ